MRDLPNVARAAYLIDGYVEADDALKDYERSGRGTDLLRALAALCRTLTLLEADDPFWRDIGSARSDADTQRITEGLEQIDDLLGLERETLAKAGLSPDVVRDLLEAIRQVSRFLDWPDDVAAESLRDAVAGARRAVCTQAGYRAENQKVTSTVAKGLSVVGGGVVIVVDALHPLPVLTEFSVYIGGKVIDFGARGFFADRAPYAHRVR